MKLSLKEKNLIRRYLIWCYKTTKEDLDRIDRYFTQLTADKKILAALRKAQYPRGSGAEEFRRKVDDFETYMLAKEKRVLDQKFSDVKAVEVRPEYWYLQERLKAVEGAIKEFLGVKELRKIAALYEEEMTRRILEAREHS